MNFQLIELPSQPGGYVSLSSSSDWEAWIRRCLPAGLAAVVHDRLVSNLKHILVGLEMKAALILPHAKRGNGTALLFEPYFQILNFEFCVGTFSICEGLGSALWLVENGKDGSAGDRIETRQWRPCLVKLFDPDSKLGLDADVGNALSVRDKLHQDKVGARAQIDWHAFTYQNAFVPASRTMRVLLQTASEDVPKTTNLTNE